jgi:hypothetical protein
MTDKERKEELIKLLEDVGFYENASIVRDREGIPSHVYDTAKEYIESTRRMRAICDDPNLTQEQKIAAMQKEADAVIKKFHTFMAILQQGGFNN